MRRFTCTTGGHSKFWEIERDALDVTVRFGRIGTAGQVQRKTHDSIIEACDYERDKITEKLGKGYVEDLATRPQTVAVECPRCSGTGRTIRDVCAECGGTGRIPAWAQARATREARDLGVSVPRLQEQVAAGVDRTRATAAAARSRPAPTTGGVPNEGMRHVCACGDSRMLWDVADARMVGAVQCVACGTWEECNPGGRRFAAPALSNRCGACSGRGGKAPSTRCLRCRGTGTRTFQASPSTRCRRCDGLMVTRDDGFDVIEREDFFSNLATARSHGAQVSYPQERAREIPCPLCTTTTTSRPPAARAPAPAPTPARPTTCARCNGTGNVMVNRATEISCPDCRGAGRSMPPAPAPQPVRPAPLGEIRCTRCNHSASSHVIHSTDGSGNRVLDQCLDCGRNEPCGDVQAERRQRRRDLTTPSPWRAMNVYALGALATIGERVYTCVRTGTSGRTAPLVVGVSINDGTIEWREVGSGRAPAPRAAAPARRPVIAKQREQRRDLDLDAVSTTAEKPAAPAVARRDLDLDLD